MTKSKLKLLSSEHVVKVTGKNMSRTSHFYQVLAFVMTKSGKCLPSEAVIKVTEKKRVQSIKFLSGYQV